VKKSPKKSPKKTSKKKGTTIESGSDSDKADEKLVIALDFGTTFSGTAFCFPNQTDPKVASVIDWPDGESASKIHSIISYDPNNDSKFTWDASVN